MHGRRGKMKTDGQRPGLFSSIRAPRNEAKKMTPEAGVETVSCTTKLIHDKDTKGTKSLPIAFFLVLFASWWLNTLSSHALS